MRLNALKSVVSGSVGCFSFNAQHVSLRPMPSDLPNLPYSPWSLPHMLRLPGTAPLADAPWLLVCDAFNSQMARRDQLLADQPEAVTAALPGAGPAIAELFDTVLAHLSEAPGYAIDGPTVRRPDGVTVALDGPSPLLVLARLVQEDLCLLQKTGDEHVLTAATLCFPAKWTLSEKLGRPLSRIHAPVAAYDPRIAQRVQRMFDAVRPDRPIWRFNLFPEETDELFLPFREAASAARVMGKCHFLRSERQVIRRLPHTGAVVFSIHSFVTPLDQVPPEGLALLRQRKPTAEM